MKWITSADLRQWADQVNARTAFPELVRDLVVASASDITDVRFPAGEAGQVRGFDGVLEAAGSKPYVPAGKSIWEFGVNKTPRTKFGDDYDKRVKEIDAKDRADLTFVFATPRTWDNKNEKLRDFVKSYREKRDFADVRYIDGAMLEHWLEHHAAVGAKHARQVVGRVPRTGARSVEEFWTEYARRFRPTLTEQVVLSGRGAQAETVVTHLMGRASSLVFVGDGPDEVSAVAAAAIRCADEKRREFLEARTLVVETDDAGRELAVADRYGYIVSPAAQAVTGLLSSYGPTVGAMGFKPGGPRFSRLERPSTRDMAEALRTMGYDEAEASSVAMKSGRSLTILERQLPSATFTPPSWLANGKDLIPALLAGGWDAGREGDRSILAELAGQDYSAFETSIRPLLGKHDAPFDRESGIWKLRAPVDAFVNLAGLLGAEHLDLLARVSVKVFSDPKPPSIGEERLNVSDAVHSTWLRNGLAGMLLMLATIHDEAGLDVGRSPPAFVDNVIGSLPGLANDLDVIFSLERQLPYLMEAAPDPLLSALELQLGGDDDRIARIFTDDGVFGGGRSAVSNLLWALEMLAWDPRRLPRASLALARLAALDPGGRSGNRPINSLREILVAWDPGTNAPLDERLATLDLVIANQPVVGWQLLVQLLPKIHDAKGPTQKPRFRDAGASSREKLTYGLVAESYDAFTDRALTMVGDNPKRWADMLEPFPQFSPPRRAQTLQLLAERLPGIPSDGRPELRRRLRQIADRHARFPDAEWSLPAAEVAQLRQLVSAMEGDDPVEQARALFDEWNPYPTEDIVGADREASVRRRDVVGRVAATGGAEAVLRLSRTVRLPGLVAMAAAAAIDDAAMVDDLLADGDDDNSPSTFAIALAGELRAKGDAAVSTSIIDLAARRGWSAARTAELLLEWPETPETWKLVKSLGDAAVAAFWTRRRPRRFDGTTAELTRLVDLFLAAGRPAAALDATFNRQEELDWKVLASILLAAAGTSEGRMPRGDMDGYLIEELLKSLRARPEMPTLELAKLEYAYFPLLEHHHRDLAIYELMATDPQIFVDMLTHVYVEDGVDPDVQTATEEERQRATASHRVLIAFDGVPGQIDGVVDAERLDAWVDGVIDAATEVRRTNVIHSYVGRVLAHSAERDGVWPQPAVAAVIERLHSPELEQGMMIERFNMRGVYTKAIFEGGVQERDLAGQAEAWAAAQPGAYLRTKAMLATIGARWTADAKQADEMAAVDRMRFE